MFLKIEQLVKKYNLFEKKTKVVIGLSGGPDSVFLLNFLAKKKDLGKIKNLIAAHLDHEWRKDSYKDVEFCNEISKKYNVPCITQKISELSISLKFDGSLEEVGRKARRFFFQQILNRYDADTIALAHHAQDQQETFFIRLLRGATLSGISAMKPKHGLYIRPLLHTSKKDILDFLDSNKIPYLTDPSNESDKFLRNRIRKMILPSVKQVDNRFDKKFIEIITNLQETDTFLQDLAKNKFDSISIEKQQNLFVDTKQLLNLHPILCQRVILYWLCLENVQFPVHRGFFNELIKFLRQAEGGTHEIHHTWKLVKQKGFVRIEKRSIL